MAERVSILKRAYRKLDQMPLGFGLPPYTVDLSDESLNNYLGDDLLDAQRVMRISEISGIEESSIECLLLENRIVYFALRRFRNSSAIFFKFSTAVDGKTVDKTKISSTIATIIAEYDTEFKQYKQTSNGSLWNRSVTTDDAE